MSQTMRAMIFHGKGTALTAKEVLKPKPKEGEILLRVKVCGVCRTDLHIKDGDLSNPKLPLILGHQIVGIVEELGENVKDYKKGDRVGVPWLGSSCQKCEYCKEGKENLCIDAKYTGYQIDGGFAEYTTCRADYAFHLPKEMPDLQIAPLLCAGIIGYRAYRKAAPKKTLGLYGFGAAAHILTQLAVYEKKEVYAFTRENDTKGQEFAKSLKAVWAGGSKSIMPNTLDAAIIFAPVGELVPLSLKSLKNDGRCVCGGIHMSDIPSFPYKDLWGEKKIESVTNLTRKDGEEFLNLAFKVPIQTKVTSYPLEKADQAIEDLKKGKFKGAAVLQIDKN